MQNKKRKAICFIMLSVLFLTLHFFAQAQKDNKNYSKENQAPLISKEHENELNMILESVRKQADEILQKDKTGIYQSYQKEVKYRHSCTKWS